MLNPNFIIYHDLIGIYALIKTKSKLNDNKFSPIGVVIDETRDMLITEKNNKIKKYIKKDHIFRFKLPNYENDGMYYYVEVPGNKLIGLPVNRLRSLKKKRRLKK